MAGCQDCPDISLLCDCACKASINLLKLDKQMEREGPTSPPVAASRDLPRLRGKRGKMSKKMKTSQEEEGWFEEYEGQLAVDAYQTNDAVVIKAPIAGVKPSDLEISITDEVMSVKGHRRLEGEIKQEDYFAQECYWGAFSRSYVLPVPVDADKAQADLKDGILTIIIPKQEKSKTRILKIGG